MTMKVFITIDVECGEFSPDYDGCVWGRLDNSSGHEYGLPLILTLLKNTNLKAVFFLEVLSSSRHGISKLKRIADRIISEGHEVQLHLHPSLRHPIRKPNTEIHLGKYPINTQIELIETGLDILGKCGVTEVTAFRAGGFGINKDTFRALKKCGVLYDSSYNLNYLNSSCLVSLTGPPRNDAFPYEHIVEFPVTCFKNPLSRNMPYRHIQITASSYWETKKALLMAYQNKMKAVVIILHSFEFINFFDKKRTMGKPVNNNILRFSKLLEDLSLNGDLFEVSGFNGLSSVYVDSIKKTENFPHYIPKMPWYLKVARQFEQLKAKL